MGHGRYHRPAVEPPPDPCRRAPRPHAAAGRARSCVGGPSRPRAGRRHWSLVWPILFVVPGWVVVRRVAPDLPRPARSAVAIVAERLRRRPTSSTSSRAVVGFGRPAVLLSAGHCWSSRAVVFARLRHRWLAPLARPTRGHRRERSGTPTGRPGSWPPATGLVVLVDLLGPTAGPETPGRLGLRRLELERPAGPRRDRHQHRRRQLPARGALLRGRAADLSLVRRLPRGDRRDRAGRDDHPGLLPDERPVRGRARARRLGARPAPDRRPPGGDDRGDPRLRRRRDGLDPAGRRRHGRQPATRSIWSARTRTTTPGPTGGRASGSPRSSGRASCRTGRRRSACPAWSPRSCWS